MARTDFVHVCNHAFLNEHRQPCLIGILADLFAPSFPYQRASVTIAAQIRAEPGSKCDLAFELTPQNGPYLRRIPFKFEPPDADAGGIFFAIQMPQIFFPNAGAYEARVLEGDRVIGLALIRVLGPGQSPPRPLATPVLTNS